MDQVQSTYLQLFKEAAESPQVVEFAKLAQGFLKSLKPKTLAALAAGGAGLGLGVPAYLIGQRRGYQTGTDEGAKNLLLAFGGGLTAGMAAPKVLNALNRVTGLGLTSGGGGGVGVGDVGGYDDYGEFASI